MKRKDHLLFCSKLILSVFSLLLTWTASAQSLIHRKYTIENGLMSNTVYAAFCDSQGYVWIGTDRGLQRFDGENFTTFHSAENRRLNDVFEIFEDSNGKIWCSTLYGKYFQIEADTLKPFIFNDIIENYMMWGKEIKGFFQDSTGSFHLSIPSTGMIQIDTLGTVTTDSHGVSSIIDTLGNLVYVDANKSLRASRNPASNQVLLLNRQDTLGLIPHGNYSSYSNCLKGTDRSFVSVFNKLFILENDRVDTLTFKNRIIDLFEDSEKRLWLTFHSGGVKCFSSSLNPDRLKFLQGLTVTKVIQDQQKGYWFTTENQGIFYVPSLFASSYPCAANDKGVEIISLDSHKHGVYATNDFGEVYEVANKYQLIHSFSELAKGQFYSEDVFVDTTGILYGNLNNNFINSNGFINAELERYDIPSHFIPHRTGRPLGYNHSGIYAFNGDLEVTLVHSFVQAKNEQSLGMIEDVQEWENHYYVASSSGTYIFNPDTRFYKESFHPALESDLVRVILVSDEFRLYGTQNSGLIVRTDTSVRQITQQNGLPSNTITALHNDGDSLLWVGSDNGVAAISLPDLTLVTLKNSRSGLINNQITEIFADSNQIYIGTMSGLSLLNRSFEHDYPMPSITDIQVYHGSSENLLTANDLKQGVKSNLNNLTFQIKAHAFNTKAKSYRYRILNLDEDWATTTSNRISYSQIPPASYIFQVQVSNDFGQWSNTFFKEIKINKPWSASFWFLSLVFIFSIATLWLTLNWVKKRTRTKMRRENLQDYYKQQAVQSRMNPHFIFNSLNSVQYFVSINDNENASKYINSFSKLLRKNIDYTGDDLVRLDKEIELIQAYCELEFIRFDGEKTYQLKVDPTLNQSKTYVPAMIVQPLVENAIWHGLIPLKEKGELMINFSANNRNLIIQITDNGVGRETAIQSDVVRRRKGKHAINFIEKRLDLYSKIFKKEFDLDYALLNPNLSNRGTVCTLTIPILGNKQPLYDNQ